MRAALLVAAGAIAGTTLTIGVTIIAVVAFARSVLDPVPEIGELTRAISELRP